MIKLTKLSGDPIVVNISQIQTVELIPETKIVFVNKEYLLVQESADEIIHLITAFQAKVYGYHRQITVERT